MTQKEELLHSVGINQEYVAEIRKIHAPNFFESFSYLVGPSIFRVLANSKWLLKLLAYIGEIAKFLLWQFETFGTIKVFLNKKRLYKAILNKLTSSPKLEIIEFGVAHGYITKFLVKQIANLKISVQRYIGFDSFEGLSQEFRNFPLGAFDNGGKFPDISEVYLFWCKGYVQETLPNVRFDLETTKLWIFDLDLYDATLFALTNVLDFIQIGDICYFDEAFDVGEFKIINDVLLTDFWCEYIGTNGQGLALLVKGKRNA